MTTYVAKVTKSNCQMVRKNVTFHNEFHGRIAIREDPGIWK